MQNTQFIWSNGKLLFTKQQLKATGTAKADSDFLSEAAIGAAEQKRYVPDLLPVAADGTAICCVKLLKVATVKTDAILRIRRRKTG